MSPPPLRRSGLFDPSVSLWRPWWLRAGLWLGEALATAALLLATLWGMLALYYEANTFVAILFGLINAGVLLAVRPKWIARGLAATGLACVLAWWTTVRPSNDRPWEPVCAIPPTATVAGDEVKIHYFRAFEYRSATDFTRRYREVTYRLSDLRTLDLYVNHWGMPLVAHTMLSFGFANGEYVCVSIEPRRELGEDYSAVKTFFRQYELFYAVGDERDVVRGRANIYRQQMYLYRLTTALPIIRETFLGCLSDLNRLAEQPRFFNALTSNCTNSIRRYPQLFGASKWGSWRLILNGSIDRLAYDRGVLDHALPFAELKARSVIGEASLAADQAPDYSARIRRGRPGFP